MRILFTGGSGKAGRHVVAYLTGRGHKVVNFDRVPLDHPDVDNVVGDVTDLGQVVGALTQLADLPELDAGRGVPGFDAVVHFAAIPRILIAPDQECYRVNVMGTYNALEAARMLGIRKVIFASSETTYGICFADGEKKPDYLPVDEDHPTVPEDSYAMSKVANEVTGRSFQERTGADIYALRINNVIEPHEYKALFPAFMENPDLRRRNIFAYIDARDLGQIVDLCVKTDGLGWQVFNCANDHTSVNLTTAELLDRYYAGVPVRGDLETYQTLYSNQRIKEVLGFREEHPWRKYLDDPSVA